MAKESLEHEEEHEERLQRVVRDVLAFGIGAAATSAAFYIRKGNKEGFMRFTGDMKGYSLGVLEEGKSKVRNQITGHIPDLEAVIKGDKEATVTIDKYHTPTEEHVTEIEELFAVRTDEQSEGS